MRAITYSSFGTATDVLTLEHLTVPTPSSGEVLVRLRTSGVNPSDIRARAGGRPGVLAPPFPKIVPHSDGAGVIEAVGPGVDSSRIGERVWIWNGQWNRAFGTAAEYIALPADQAVRLPDQVSFEQGAILGIPALTATHVVLGAGPVAGKRVFVSGGAGTVGHLAVQIAKASGAQVIASCRGADQARDVLTAGADAVVDYTSASLAADILDASGGALMDHVVEVEFGQNIEVLAQVIAERGRIVSFGSARDMTPALPFYPLMFKAVSIELVLVYLLNTAERTRAIQNLTELLETNALTFRISDVLPLADCAKAHDLIAEGRRTGSVVLSI